ncbi:hypothetical protein SASPL_130490 [Salvia splendens]|uniref:Myb/SANT-like domain-containing protein n=1 Tax=Salvia splendens TaxID=180675 RepID=A0A8X8X7G2_SALSN|nr:hypothetical protein SASPL_130490 [Salvia splendens]
MQSGLQHGQGLSPLSGTPNVCIPNTGKRPWGGSPSSRGDCDVVIGTPQNKFRKGERSRRMWTPKEEDILAATLLELTATGWKSDNGFRAGSGSWKKSYGLLRSILSRTGVGWNHHGDHKFDCSDEQWEQIVQADKDTKYMQNKSWPLWETWKTIFGKDRASGLAAEEIGAAAKNIRAQVSGGSQVYENDYHPSFEISSLNRIRRCPTTLRKSKKPSPDADLMEFLGNLHERTDARVEMISKRIGYEFDMGQARQEVFEKLCTVDGLSLAQRYRLCNILGDKPQRLEVFIGIPVNARLGYLLCLIEDGDKEV